MPAFQHGLLPKSKFEFRPGMVVLARRRITEDDAPPDPQAEPCMPGWVHCEEGEVGVVVTVYDFQNGHPDVFFLRTETVTLCFDYELEPVLIEA